MPAQPCYIWGQLNGKGKHQSSMETVTVQALDAGKYVLPGRVVGASCIDQPFTRCNKDVSQSHIQERPHYSPSKL